MIARIIHDNAARFPDKNAVINIGIGGTQEAQENSLTFGALDRRAGALAAVLSKIMRAQEKIVLLYPAGLDFITAYVACQYAGVVPIPVAPPDSAHLSQAINHIAAVLQDSGAGAILTTREIRNMLPAEITAARIMVSDEDHTDEFFFNDAVNEDEAAHIQYSSGTTGKPKGIVITQRNLKYSLRSNSSHWKLAQDDVALTWTPHYYIYGVVTGILLPLYNANTNYILSTLAVINDPSQWLHAISRYQVTYSGSANFGYQLCIDKISADQIMTMDLSRWRIAVCGGEFIQAETLISFAGKFKPAGFRFESMCPSYGMSEMTGFVSANVPGEQPKFRNHAQQYVSSGKVAENISVKIIHPHSLAEMPAGETGEICLSGPALTIGYVKESYQFLKLDGIDYYRTGDLGFMHEDELFPVSRLKEIIIVNGKNYYPQEIEAAAQQAFTVSHHHAVAAVSLPGKKTEQIIILQEIAEGMAQQQMAALGDAIRQAVLTCCGIRVERVAFLKAGSLPRTRSGKLRRNHAREAYLSHQLAILHEDSGVKDTLRQADLLAVLKKSEQLERKKLINECLQRLMHDILKIDSTREVDTRFFDLGMTSLLAVEFKDRLQSMLQDHVRLTPGFIFEYPSISAMTAYIEQQFKTERE